METTLYSQKGDVKGKVQVPESIFGLPWNADLVHQVIVSMESSARNNTAHTKNRGEVRGGGKKPWKQKGTGQARHGSTRSPIWVGGGVAHGPRNEKNYDRKVNRKMKAKALFTILSKKYKDGEIIFVDTLSFKEPKTKLAVEMLGSWNNIPELKGIVKRKNALAIFMPGKTQDVSRTFRNIGNISFEDTSSLNPMMLLSHKRIVFVAPEETFTLLSSKLGTKSSETAKPVKKVVAKKTKAKAK